MGSSGGSTASSYITLALHGVLIAEVAVLGTELYLLYYYNSEIEEEMEEYLEANHNNYYVITGSTSGSSSRAQRSLPTAARTQQQAIQRERTTVCELLTSWSTE